MRLLRHDKTNIGLGTRLGELSIDVVREQAAGESAHIGEIGAHRERYLIGELCRAVEARHAHRRHEQAVLAHPHAPHKHTQHADAAREYAIPRILHNHHQTAAGGVALRATASRGRNVRILGKSGQQAVAIPQIQVDVLYEELGRHAQHEQRVYGAVRPVLAAQQREPREEREYAKQGDEQLYKVEGAQYKECGIGDEAWTRVHAQHDAECGQHAALELIDMSDLLLLLLFEMRPHVLEQLRFHMRQQLGVQTHIFCLN